MLHATHREEERLDASLTVDDRLLPLPHLHLSNCLKSIETGNLSSVSELLNILSDASTAALSEESPMIDNARSDALDALYRIRDFVSLPLLEETVKDALFYELPKTISEFAGISDGCVVVVDEIIDCLVAKCSPRDMLSMFCEALSITTKSKNPFCYAAPLLTGLAKVTRCIQRRPFQQLAAVLPITLDVLKFLVTDNYADEKEAINLFDRSLSIADSMQATGETLAGALKENLGASLSLFVLQLTALITFSIRSNIKLYLPLICRISSILNCSDCSYVGLITGSDVTRLSRIKNEVEEDYLQTYFCDIELGASLVVIWGQAFEEATQSANENLFTLKDEMRHNRMKRFQAFDMLKHVLLSGKLSWEFKQHAIEFLLVITNQDSARQDVYDHQNDCSTKNLYPLLQAITSVIMYSPIVALRKESFEALKKVLEDTPISLRFETLQDLIRNSKISSMTAILLDLYRGELHKERIRNSPSNWTSTVLDLVQLVLKPSEGGPPQLPEQCDSVLAALNLFRFVLLTESASETNYTGIMVKTNLQKATTEWLHPLRTLVTAIIADNKNDQAQLAEETVYCLYPIQLVLYRCIELVEEKQQLFV